MRLNFFGSVLSASGYATGNLNMLMEMYKQNIDVSLLHATPPDKNFVLDETTRSILHEMEIKQFDYNAPTLQRCPGNVVEPRLPGNPAIAYSVFECTRLPSKWVKTFNKMDAVWSTSSWGKHMFEDSGVLHDVKIIPEGVDVERFNPETVKPFPNIKDPDKFTFLTVGQFHKRKGFDVLFDAYLDSFDYNDPVELILKTWIDGNIKKEQQWIQKVISEYAKRKNLKKIPKIKIHTFPVSPEMIPQFYKSADAFILISRGEGSGLPVAEAMAMGLPTIVTNCSGQTEFFNVSLKKKPVVYPIEIEGLSKVEQMDHISTDYRHRFWYEPSLESTISQMKYVFYHQREARETGKRAREHVKNNFTWTHCINRMKELLSEISNTSCPQI